MPLEPTGSKIAFDGESSIVTGAAQGIGKGIAESLASSGANVAVVDVNEEKAEETVEEIHDDYGVEAIAVECDVTDHDAVAAMVDEVLDAFGRIDHLVNNAGVNIEEPTFLDSKPEDWDTIIGICQKGTLSCTYEVLPHMVEQGEGAVVNFASDSYKGNDPGLAVYGGSKAANVSFTSTVAKEVGDDGVRVNCVSPGATYTPATRTWLDKYEDTILDSYSLNRLGQPSDIADAVAFLCSDAASWITGETLSVNGGYFRG